METSIFMEISRYSYINTDCPSQEEHSPSLGSCLYTVNLATASGRPGRKRADLEICPYRYMMIMMCIYIRYYDDM